MKLTLQLLLSGVLLAVLLVFGGCETEPPATPQTSPIKTIKRDDMLVVARFLDEGTLKERYGPKYNPFIASMATSPDVGEISV